MSPTCRSEEVIAFSGVAPVDTNAAHHSLVFMTYLVGEDVKLALRVMKDETSGTSERSVSSQIKV